MKTTMKAQAIHQYGDVDVLHLEDVALLKPAADEILIQVAATSINPADLAIRAGYLQMMTSLDPQLIPGLDVSGVVDEVGADIQGFKKGDRIIAKLDLAKSGASAEYAVAKAVQSALAPSTLPLADSAVIPLAGLTAWQAVLEHGHVTAGQRVLVVGAAGGVGSFAVQLAKLAGAYVIGVASARNFQFLNDLGVDQLIDHHMQKIEDAIQDKLDVIINLAPITADAVTNLLSLLKKDGILVSPSSPADNEIAERLGVKAVHMMTVPNPEQLTSLVELIDNGSLKLYISERAQLQDLPAMHAKSASGYTNGKILIVVNDNL